MIGEQFFPVVTMIGPGYRQHYEEYASKFADIGAIVLMPHLWEQQLSQAQLSIQYELEHKEIEMAYLVFVVNTVPMGSCINTLDAITYAISLEKPVIFANPLASRNMAHFCFIARREWGTCVRILQERNKVTTLSGIRPPSDTYNLHALFWLDMMYIL